MGCACVSSVSKQAQLPDRDVAAAEFSSQEESARLAALVSDDQWEKIAKKCHSQSQRNKMMRELADKSPARIKAVNLAGDELAALEVSVHASVQALETCIRFAADIDKHSCAIQMTYEGTLLKKAQTLSDVGIKGDTDALITVVKSEKKKDPTLDRQLFHEAWMGGGHALAIQALLEANADPDGFTYSDGDRAIHVAAGRGHADCVRLLLEAGADGSIPGVYGMTPWDRCSQASTTYWKGNHKPVQDVLRAHGADKKKAKRISELSAA